MTRALAHRGPDAEGIAVDGPVAMGHRRLSVIDLSTTNNQPMLDARGGYLLVFNGEIYNFRDVRGELEGLGHRFSTQGDTEVSAGGVEGVGRVSTRSAQRHVCVCVLGQELPDAATLGAIG